jgi:hypothetical protein
MTTTLFRPTDAGARAFYDRALPIVTALCDAARAWRDQAPADPEAIRAHAELTWLAIRLDLRRQRAAGRHPISRSDRPAR